MIRRRIWSVSFWSTCPELSIGLKGRSDAGHARYRAKLFVRVGYWRWTVYFGLEVDDPPPTLVSLRLDLVPVVPPKGDSVPLAITAELPDARRTPIQPVWRAIETYPVPQPSEVR